MFAELMNKWMEEPSNRMFLLIKSLVEGETVGTDQRKIRSESRA